jgi:hypothetical protein
MEDSNIGTDATGTVTADAPEPSSATPTHESPIEQAKGVAAKVLAMITGRKS